MKAYFKNITSTNELFSLNIKSSVFLIKFEFCRVENSKHETIFENLKLNNLEYFFNNYN